MSSRSEGVPRRIGEHEILFELASGGMATVFLARQTGDAGFERLVALKRVHRHLLADPEVFAMASDEARLAALVRHPNVVPVVGVLDEGNELVLVQEYVEGASLATLSRRLAREGRRLALNVAVKITVDALRGLHAAHEAKDLRGEDLGLVHRDVSPQNLLVGSDGITRVIDFGVARAERRMTMTKAGVVKGKLQYMAPEQLADKPVDRRADVFAAASVLYELVAGCRVFGDGDDAAIMSRTLLGEIDWAPLEAACPELVPLLERALAKDPRERPASALELSRALSRAILPADDEEVQREVVALYGADLEETREKIRSGLGGEEEGEGEGEREREDEGEGERGRKRGRMGLVVAGLVVGVAGIAMVVVATSDPVVVSEAGAAGAAVVTATAARTAESARAAETASVVLTSSASAVSSSSTHVRPARPATASTAARSAAASTSSDLLPSPYPRSSR